MKLLSAERTSVGGEIQVPRRDRKGQGHGVLLRPPKTASVVEH